MLIRTDYSANPTRHIRVVFFRISLIVLLLSYIFLGGILGCGRLKRDETALIGDAVEYTVVEDGDLPEKLRELIEERKGKEFKLTFTTDEYTYMTVGYGVKPTDGYSITVDGVTVSEDAVYIKTSLYGPKEKEQVNESTTTPYVVVKIEKRGKTVIYI